MNANFENTMFIVSTSHMDLDWQYTFDSYYEYGPRSSGDNGNLPVKDILALAIKLMQAPPPDGAPAYQYNLAEVAWLVRYTKDHPDVLAKLEKLRGQFFFLGGGMSSPDNLVCNGEAFIRNYLVGRHFVKQASLGHLLTDVCWIPDDFGSDPQLPVVLNAMGMKGVSFARVPGEQPLTSQYVDTAYTPLDGSPAMNAQLKSDGVTFFWKAADGSEILAVYMSDIPQSPGYGVIWNQEKTSDTATLVEFVSGSPKDDSPTARNVNFPGSLFMAPCGGDFSTPSDKLTKMVAAFNEDNGQGTGVKAVMGTFEDYIAHMNVRVANDPALLKTYTNLDPSNYWTGHFASRVQLKIDQQKATNILLASETLLTLLRLQSSVNTGLLDQIKENINRGWEWLSFSTHHDYVTGTSVDSVYEGEQLNFLSDALTSGRAALSQAKSILGESVLAQPTSTEIPYVVFNACGFTRKTSCLAEIPADPSLQAIQSYRRMNSSGLWPIQRTLDGSILIRLDNMESTSYECVYLSSLPPNKGLPDGEVSAVNENNGHFTLSNNLMRVTVDSKKNWAIRSLIDLTDGDTELFPGANSYGNQVQVYNETFSGTKGPTFYGNLYQMGNEFNNLTEGEESSDPQATNGFSLDTTASTFTSNGGRVGENGPYRASFIGSMENSQGLTVEIVYTLEYNDPQLRITINGEAGGSENSVVTAWDMDTIRSVAPVSMDYGTANHWNNSSSFTPYWYGPTFRPVHDYVSVVNNNGSSSMALYNEGMRSWAFYNNQIMGILFRNAAGGGRGASGTDMARHTQNFAFRLPGAGSASTCGPLKESMAFQQPLIAAPVVNSGFNMMRDIGMIVWADDDSVLIRMARTQSYDTVPGSINFVVRCYQPTNNTSQSRDIYLPCLRDRSASVTLVTALEEEIRNAQPLPLEDEIMVAVPEMPTLTTLRVWVQL